MVKFCLVHAHNGQSSGHVVFDYDNISVIDNDCNSLAGICSLLSIIILKLKLIVLRIIIQWTPYNRYKPRFRYELKIKITKN